MKRIGVLLVACVIGIFTHADEGRPESVTVVENHSTIITVPFAVRQYAPANKDVARIESVSDTILRVTGLKPGECDLDVMGDNGLQRKYTVKVEGDLVSVLDVLTQDLDSVPEVHAEIRGHFIRIDGEVSSIAKWEYLVKVISSYEGVVKNFVRFFPGPETLTRLQETLEQANFKVQFKRFTGESKTWPYGVVALDLNKKTRVLSVQANCLQAAQRVSILSILNGEPWLAVNIDEDWKKPVKVPPEKEPYIIHTLLDLPIASPTIRMSVAYLVIGEKDLQTLGNRNGAGPVLQGTFGTIQNLLHGGGNHGNQAQLSLGLDSVIEMFAENGISRVSQKGYTTMKSWDGKGAHFKSGGTVHVKTGASVQSGGVAVSASGDLKPIPYGFDMRAKGGLETPDTVSIDMNMSISSVAPMGDSGDYDQKEDSTEQTISCKLGKTTLVSGFAQLLDANTPAKGFPIFRHTPLLQWFVAESGKEVSDRRLVMMIYPEIVDMSRDGDLNVDREINIPVTTEAEKTTDQRLEERKEHTGFWSWLNWFTF